MGRKFDGGKGGGLPVARVPPVGVEVAIGEAGDFCECTEDIFENDEEGEVKCYHEGEK